jgi:hypothetical protein
VSGMQNLEALHIYSCYSLTTVNAITDCPSLTELEFYYNTALVNLGSLSDLSTVKTLWLLQIKDTDIPDLSNMKLTLLNVVDCSFTNHIDFTEQDELETLVYRSNHTTFPDISPCIALKSIEFQMINVTGTIDLRDNVDLETIRFVECDVMVHAPIITGLTKVKTVYYRWCYALVDIGDFTDMEDLTSIQAGESTHIADIPILSNNPSLQNLYLPVAALTENPNLADLPSLTSLHLSGSAIAEFPDFSLIPNLVSLTLSGYTTVVDALDLTYLTHLVNLTLNGLTHSSLPSLSGLSLTFLYINSMPNLTAIPNLPTTLTQVRFDYLTVLDSTPNLTNLNVLQNVTMIYNTSLTESDWDVLFTFWGTLRSALRYVYIRYNGTIPSTSVKNAAISANPQVSWTVYV